MPPTTVARIRVLSAGEELALVQQIEATAFPTIICVSDLHLGAGIDAATGRHTPLENFLSDGPFSRFLAHQQGTLPGPHLLVLNGDILDFLRVTTVPRDAGFEAWAARLNMFGDPRTADDLRRAVGRHEREYGLQTHEFKSLWKLDVMAAGHPVFFSALARWVKNDGTIVYARGNHDPEQYWPLIRRAFRDILCGYTVDVDPKRFERQVVFVDESFCITNAFFMHGSDYESLTRTANPPIRPGAAELELPLGSLVNRYIINKLEHVSPFLDNLKPVSDAVLEALKQRPTLLFGLLNRSALLLARALKRRRGNTMLLAAAMLGVFVSFLVPVAVAAFVLVYVASPGFRVWVSHTVFNNPWLRTALGVAGVLAPFIVRTVINWLHRRRTYREGEDDFAGGSLAALRRRFPQPVTWPTVYTVLGHTHAEDVQSLPPLPGSERTIYLNTGTWIPRWLKERPDLIGRLLFTFVRFQRYDGVYAHETLRWDDAAGADREATILAPRS